METTCTTFKNMIMDHLTENGMFESDAEKVLENIINDEANSAMSGRWGKNVNRYPDEMKAVVLFVARTAALEWIDENKPNAFYRGMLE